MRFRVNRRIKLVGFLFCALLSLRGDRADGAFVCDAAPLSAAEVAAILESAATALNHSNMTIAVADRPGNILGIFRKPGADGSDDELAASLARTGAFFSNNQAPLSSRTVRSISGIHFPAGVRFTPNAALYGIENTNRGCELNVIFDPGRDVPPAKKVAGGPCNGADQSGCGLGITTGKADVTDSNSTAVNPGGLAVYRGCTVVGGVGVVVRDGPADPLNPPALLSNHAEFAALSGAATEIPGVAKFLPFPAIGIPVPELVVFLDGIALPFVEQKTRPKGAAPDASPPPGAITFGPVNGRAGSEIEGYLVSPQAGAFLTQAEVFQIVEQAIKTANRTRAAIRLPIGQRARMVIAVGDVDGTILALYRMPDATVFSIDVAVAKARNVVYFSGLDPNVQTDLPGVPAGTAVTNRTIGFGSQPLFPPGIDGSNPGPFFDLFLDDTANPCSQGSQAPNANQSGIVFFPGSTPLYKDGVLIGGLGISGDGVEQDDVVSNGGAKGFLPPAKIRADRVKIRGVRLPYFKFNRNPFR
jgi:uncharacterized protein GlcG (DUF336 family)